MLPKCIGTISLKLTRCSVCVCVHESTSNIYQVKYSNNFIWFDEEKEKLLLHLKDVIRD